MATLTIIGLLIVYLLLGCFFAALFNPTLCTGDRDRLVDLIIVGIWPILGLVFGLGKIFCFVINFFDTKITAYNNKDKSKQVGDI